MATNTGKILKTMFTRLLQIEVEESVILKLAAVIDSVMERVGDRFDLETVQGQNTFRALLCSMVVHGWGNGMHPFHNPSVNQEGQPVDGRVKKALFEPDQNVRVRQQIDDILGEISQNRWPE